jgi:hypothetical protein
MIISISLAINRLFSRTIGAIVKFCIILIQMWSPEAPAQSIPAPAVSQIS